MEQVSRMSLSSFLPSQLNDCLLPVAKECLQKLNGSPSVEDQVNHIRSVQQNAEITVELKRRLFVAIYLACPLKHAVRGAVVK